MNKKEIEAVSNLPAPKRYEYFIKKVSDSEVVWGLFDDGWVISEDDNGNPLIPFWSHKEYADLCAVDEWKNYQAKQIKLDEFMQEWLPDMKEDGIKPSIFMNNVDSTTLDIDTLVLHLEEELKKY